MFCSVQFLSGSSILISYILDCGINFAASVGAERCSCYGESCVAVERTAVGADRISRGCCVR